MASFIKNKICVPLHAASSGITLLEMVLGMLILSILSIGVSSLVKAGVETQMSERDHQNLQVIGMNIVDDLRNDVRNADNVQVLNGGDTLRVTLDSDTNQIATYTLSGTKFQRTSPSGSIKVYNDPAMYSDLMKISCTGSCFQGKLLNSQNRPKQILVQEMKVEKQLSNGNAGSIIDQHFGNPNFTIKDFALDVASATEFQ